MPVYNEERWISRSLDAVLGAARHAGITLDIVVVDDGSTDSTPARLADYERRGDIRLHRQANAGRMAARAAGVGLVTSDAVLLLDSRVIIEPSSLAWLVPHLAAHPERRVWCGHVDVETSGNPYAAFWSGLVKIGWRRYTSHPRLVSFGEEEFDLYPKGTTCLLIPTTLLVDSMRGFASLYDKASLSSDDTRLLRDVARQERIWISPEFRFRYHGKQGLKGFVRQSYFRGTTFVDGYLGQPGPIRTALLAGLVAAPVTLALAARRPKLAGAVVATAAAAVPLAVNAVGGEAGEVRSAAILTPAFIPLFGAGVLRGLLLAAQARLRHNSRPAGPDESRRAPGGSATAQ